MTDSKNTPRQFVKVEEPSVLLPILESRFPQSVNVYNCAKVANEYAAESTWCVLDGDVSNESWILLVMRSEVFGQEICISRSPHTPITEEVKQAFSSTPYIAWLEPFDFIALDLGLSAMIADISIRDKGNCTGVHPCHVYFMDIQEALQLDDNFDLEPGTVLKGIDDPAGIFLLESTWKYTNGDTKSYIQKCAGRNESAGIYLQDGKAVSAVVITFQGFIGILYTLKEHRGKGYAKMCMHSIMKKIAKKGFIPCCAVEFRNEASKELQKKIGFKNFIRVEYVICKMAEF